MKFTRKNVHGKHELTGTGIAAVIVAISGLISTITPITYKVIDVIEKKNQPIIVQTNIIRTNVIKTNIIVKKINSIKKNINKK